MRPRLEVQRKAVTYKLPPSLLLAIDREAKRSERTKTQVVEEAVVVALGGVAPAAGSEPVPAPSSGVDRADVFRRATQTS